MADTTPARTELRAGQLGVPAVVFLVLAAVAPLTVAIVILPMGIAFGNGGGLPLSILIVGVALLLFAIGYGQMSKELVNAGGFYAIAVRGLGRPAGLVTGLVATIGYNFFTAGALATLGFFAGSVVLPALIPGFGGIDWLLAGVVLFAIAFALAVSGIDVSAIVLAISLILETAILLAFGISVLVQTGFSWDAFARGFSPEVVGAGSVWIGFLVVGTAFIGFEATALFSEEAKDPKRTIPRATIWAIVVVALIHTFVAWAAVSAIGVEQSNQAASDSLAAGDLMINLLFQYLGQPIGSIGLVLLVVSLFAAQLTFHNSAARYLFALGRARVLPSWLAKTNRRGAPHRALMVNALFAVVIGLVFWLWPPTDADGAALPPVLTIVPVFTGFGTLAVIIVQAIAALSVVVHFRRTRDRRWWATLIAPGIGFLALVAFSVGALLNFAVVAGSDATYVVLMPWLLVVALVAGLAYAWYLRSRRPAVYDGLERDLERFDEAFHEPAIEAAESDRPAAAPRVTPPATE